MESKNILQPQGNSNNHSSNKEFYYRSVLKQDAINELCRELTSSENIDIEVEKFLVEMADNFMNTVLDSSCSLAKHKNSDKVEIEDFASAINDNFGICEPSLYTSALNQMNIDSLRSTSTNDHKKRLELTKEETKNANI